MLNDLESAEVIVRHCSSGKPDNPLVNDMDPVVLRLGFNKNAKVEIIHKVIIRERAALQNLSPGFCF